MTFYRLKRIIPKNGEREYLYLISAKTSRKGSKIIHKELDSHPLPSFDTRAELLAQEERLKERLADLQDESSNYYQRMYRHISSSYFPLYAERRIKSKIRQYNRLLEGISIYKTTRFYEQLT